MTQDQSRYQMQNQQRRQDYRQPQVRTYAARKVLMMFALGFVTFCMFVQILSHLTQ